MSERAQILDELSIIICEVLKTDAIKLDETTTAADIAGWDSLSHMSIISSIENQYQIKFSFIDVVSMECIGDLVDLIESKK